MQLGLRNSTSNHLLDGPHSSIRKPDMMANSYPMPFKKSFTIIANSKTKVTLKVVMYVSESPVTHQTASSSWANHALSYVSYQCRYMQCFQKANIGYYINWRRYACNSEFRTAILRRQHRTGPSVLQPTRSRASSFYPCIKHYASQASFKLWLFTLRHAFESSNPLMVSFDGLQTFQLQDQHP